MLDITQKEKAKNYIKEIAKRFIELKPKSSGNQSEISMNATSQLDQDSESDDEVEALLASNDDQNVNENMELNVIVNQLALYDKNQERLKRSSNILEYWAATTYTSLSEVANILLSTPATQVSVERLFSIVKYVFSSLRTKMTGEILEDVIFLKANNVNFVQNKIR
jgi:hypothetical protein